MEIKEPPEDMASVALIISSEASSYASGADIALDGGLHRCNRI